MPLLESSSPHPILEPHPDDQFSPNAYLFRGCPPPPQLPPTVCYNIVLRCEAGVGCDFSQTPGCGFPGRGKPDEETPHSCGEETPTFPPWTPGPCGDELRTSSGYLKGERRRAFVWGFGAREVSLAAAFGGDARARLPGKGISVWRRA
ncbi:hypothetical protein COCON_G00080470 [Conger conger]|uniref:Uncharacterized protein n=1 Tax=Conger conger TaxID=82655 RepID=A0A9Q1DPG0_CONCO|nr:hypothetical protein COCON_G00080470 [Conger conger]